MAKQGMKRPERTHTKPRNEVAAVPEIQGKAKHGKDHVKPIIAGTEAPSLKVYHSKPHSAERQISSAYPDTTVLRSFFIGHSAMGIGIEENRRYYQDGIGKIVRLCERKRRDHTAGCG